MTKITKNKMKADVIYKSKYSTESDIRVVTGNTDDNNSVVKVKPKPNSDWSIDHKDNLLVLEENGAGFFVTIPAHGDYTEEKTFHLDYSEAFHLLVALTAEFKCKNHELLLDWTKTTEEFLQGVIKP